MRLTPGHIFTGWLWLCAAGAVQAGDLEVRITDISGAPLPEAVVYALPAGGSVPAARGKTHLIDQIKKKFVPMVSAMQTGTYINFPNKDNIRHHVYSFSPAKTFNIKLYHGTPAKPILFDEPGTVILGCNIHDNMVAHVLIVDTPYFALTDASGVARLQNVPPGAYTIEAWHYRMADPATPPAQARDFTSAATPPLAFTIPLGAGPPTQRLLEE